MAWAHRLSRDSDLTLAEAENYIKEYFARFPGIRIWKSMKMKAKREGYVETLFGRRRDFPIFENHRLVNEHESPTTCRTGS